MRKGSLAAALTVAALAVATPSMAVDPYESVQHFAPLGDDNASTKVTFTTGFVQVHDLDQAGGGEDQDWIAVPTLARHSYEARISSGNIAWDWGACTACGQFERVSAGGTILTEDVGIINEGGVESYDRSVRWIATSSTTNEFVRITGSTDFTETANSIYQIRFWDTTYSVPRWNNANGQVTVFLISSLIQASATVRIDFYNATGSLLATSNFTLGPNQLITLNTGTIPALAGISGHAYVSHTAGYGGLAGKAVALDAATGFSFDTPMVPVAN